MRITFRVDGEPKGQPRARAFNRGTRAGVYDPGTANGWKSLIAAAALPLRPKTPIVDGVALACSLYFPRPKRLMRARDPDGPVPHAAKPDADNAAKAIMDALTQLGFWRDDAQVNELRVSKWYHGKSDRSGAVITIETEEKSVPS